MQLKRIFHPTDFSASAEQALRLAAQLAVSQKATLHVCHVSTLHEDTAQDDSRTLDQYVERAQALLLRGPGVPKPERTLCRAVLPFDAIMDAVSQQQPDLIVMGTHGRTGFKRLLMGSTAEKVLRHAACNVLTVKADAPLPTGGVFKRLLVPVDFSPCASRGLDAARQLRTPGETTLVLAHVVEPVPPMYYAGGVSSRFELDLELRKRIEEGLRTWSGDIPDSRLVISEGSPVSEIARLAEDMATELIVMSTHGLTGAEHLLVGSVTERVCRAARVPVLSVR